MKKFLRRAEYIFVVLFLCISILPAQSMQNTKIKENSTLSLTDCVNIAIDNSPLIKRKEYFLQIANSNLGIAKSVYFPTIGAGAGIYQEYNSNKEYREGSLSYRELPTVEVYLKQLLWDFGKSNSYIRMEHFYKIAAEYEFTDSICSTIYDVKSKYFRTLQAHGILEIAHTNLLINKKNFERAKQLAKKDSKHQADLADAEVYFKEAQMEFTEAQNNYNLAMSNLENSLYVANSPDFRIKDIDTFTFLDSNIPDLIKTQKAKSNNTNFNIINVTYKTGVTKNCTGCNIKPLPIDGKAAYDWGYKNSPDLWALQTTVQAMRQAVTYTKRQYFPELTGGVGYGYLNERHLSNMSNNDFNMYLNLSTAVNIKQLKHQIDKAEYELNLANNDVDLFRENLYFQIKKCLYNVHKSEAQIPLADTRAQEALEDFNIVSAQYEQGKTDYVAFQNARKNYDNAQLEYVNQLYEYNESLAVLEHTIHYHIDDVHAEAEHAMHYHYKDLLNKLESSMHCEHKDEEEHHKKDETETKL